jgi:hypothetical protein
MKFQRWGPLTICQGPSCGRISDWGSDPNLLGRWFWVKCRGSHGLQLIVVTVYRPVVNQGGLSTYQHHKTVLLDNDRDECPRKILLDDLQQAIVNWKGEGLQIIVAGDFNENIRKGTYLRTYFRSIW